MIVLGVDPGLRTSGYAVIEQKGPNLTVLDAGTIKADTQLPLEKRLAQIYEDIDTLLTRGDIDVMAIEELYAHYKHPRTAILMGHARGVFLLASARHHVQMAHFSATRIKKSLIGYGRATKAQVQQAVTRQLNLAIVPEPADVADAMAIAMCCLNEYSRPSI